MKNLFTNVGSFATAKLPVIIAIAMITVIGFSFIACGDGDDDNGIGGKSGNGGSWPSGSLLSKYGLSGLSAPSGAHDMYYMETINTGSSSYDSALMIRFDGPSSAETAVANWFNSNWTKRYEMNTSDANVRYYEKAGDLMAAFSYFKEDGEYMIMAYTGWSSN